MAHRNKMEEAVRNKVIELQDQFDEMDNVHLDKMYEDTKKDIENHFDNLIGSINERRDTLLKSLDNSFTLLKRRLSEEQIQLKMKIDGTTQALEAGSAIFPFNPEGAMNIWKSIDLIRHKNEEFKLFAILPKYISHMIKMNGSVVSFPLQCRPGKLTTIAGSSEGFVDGIGEEAQLSQPNGIVFNSNDNCLYICDIKNNMIRKMNHYGEVSSFSGVPLPCAIAFNQVQNQFYVACGNHTIYKVSSAGHSRLFVGVNGKAGNVDGDGSKATFNNPCRVVINKKTNEVFVTEFTNHTIRKITPEGFVSTFAGNKKEAGHADGRIEVALFCSPTDLIFYEKERAMIVCDRGNDCLRKISGEGVVTTMHKIARPRFIQLIKEDVALITSGTQIFTIHLNDVNKVEPFIGEEGGTQLPTQFKFPAGLAVDHQTNTCYVADLDNHSIRKLTFW